MSSMGGEELLVRASLKDELTGPLRDVRDELKATGRDAETAGRKANVGARGFDKMAAGAGRLAKFAGRTLVRGVGLGAAAIVAAGGAAATMGIKTAAAMQTAKIGFTTMLGSGRKANAFLRDLAAFAAKTPFEFPELQTAASSLISAGIQADKVIPIMTTLGDVTAGMGTGSEGIQRATVALQQMNAAGKITGEDLNQLRDAGIPVFDLLAAATGKSKKEVAALAQAGKLGGKELTQLMKALETGKGLERFNGLMEKQSASLSGVWSTLSDTVNMGLATAFKPAIPVLSDLVLAASGLATKAMPDIQAFVGNAVDLGVDLAGAFKTDGIDGMAALIEQRFGVDATGALDGLRGILEDVGTVITDVLVPAFDDSGVGLTTLLTPLGLARTLLGFMADHTTLTRVALEGLVVVLTAAKAATIAKTAVDKISLIWLKAHTVGTKTHMVVMGAAKVATLVWAGAQKVLNAVMKANPIGLVITALTLLVGGLVIAYKKSDTFRKIVDGAFHAVGKAAGWLWNKAIKPAVQFIVNGYGMVFDAIGTVLDALGKVPGFGWAKKAGDAMHTAADKAHDLADALDDVGRDRNVRINLTPPSPAQVANVNRQLARAGGTIGDTTTSRARGGNLANTMAAHSLAITATGARPRITNITTGGGGHGHGSGDHQAGRALDLQGKGLAKYGAYMRAAGGYAEFHGSGASRHLHTVPPAMGDTITTRAHTRVATGGRGGQHVTIAAGAVRVQVTNPTSNVDVAAAVRQGIEEFLRDQEERR